MNEPKPARRSLPIDNGQWRKYQDWQRHILTSRPKIPLECRRSTLIAFCHALAFDTASGERCFKGDSKIGKELDIDRHYLAKYRWLAVELGWFAPTGKKTNRVEELTIAIPDYQCDVIELPEELRSKDKRTSHARQRGSADERASKGLHVGVFGRETEPETEEPDPWATHPIGKREPAQVSSEPAPQDVA